MVLRDVFGSQELILSELSNRSADKKITSKTHVLVLTLIISWLKGKHLALCCMHTTLQCIFNKVKPRRDFYLKYQSWQLSSCILIA